MANKSRFRVEGERRPMLGLVEKGVLAPRKALKIARAIHDENEFIGDEVLAKFRSELERMIKRQ